MPVAESDEARCFAGNLAWLLYRAHWALASELTAALEPLGVSARGYHVLRAALSGEHTQTELAEMVGLDKTTMVAPSTSSSGAGLAERRLPTPHDRRARIVVGHHGRQAQGRRSREGQGARAGRGAGRALGSRGDGL